MLWHPPIHHPFCVTLRQQLQEGHIAQMQWEHSGNPWINFHVLNQFIFASVLYIQYACAAYHCKGCKDLCGPDEICWGSITHMVRQLDGLEFEQPKYVHPILLFIYCILYGRSYCSVSADLWYNCSMFMYYHVSLHFWSEFPCTRAPWHLQSSLHIVTNDL